METRTVPAWEIWRNPILIRYMRARLRLRALVLNGVPALVLTTFVFFVAYFGPRHHDPVLQARSAFLAVFWVQCLIVMLRGTFSVAAGVTREGIEGLLEYQRLTPMSPLAKIVGYVLGLPILETVLFLMTLPFTLIAVSVGEIAWPVVGKLYLVLASSTLLYHTTGFVAGIVVKNRVMAGLLSQLLMIGLYVFLPQLSRFGFVLFEYLTVWPLFVETLQGLLPSRGPIPFSARSTAPFFEAEIPLLWFTLLVQGYLLVVFLLVLYRKVRSEEAHLLGKFSAIPVLGGLVAILLGTVLPGVRTGSVFLSMAPPPFMEIGNRFRPRRAPFDLEMVAFPAVLGSALLLILLIIIFAVTPSEEQRVKGLRLARKRGRFAVPWHSDAASSLPTTLACGAIIVAVWMIFLDHLMDSRWYDGWRLARDSWLLFPLAILVPALCFQLVLEVGGRAVWFFTGLFLWLVPLMVGVIILLATRAAGEVVEAVIYIMSVSGLSLPINATRLGFKQIPVTPATETLVTPATGAFGFSLFLHLVAAAFLVLWAVRKARELRARATTAGQSAE